MPERSERRFLRVHIQGRAQWLATPVEGLEERVLRGPGVKRETEATRRGQPGDARRAGAFGVCSDHDVALAWRPVELHERAHDELVHPPSDEPLVRTGLPRDRGRV